MTNQIFDVLGYLVATAGCTLTVFGFALLAVTWFAPRLLDSSLFQPPWIGRFPRTKANLTVVSCYWSSWGIYLTMTNLESPRPLKLSVLAITLLLVIPFMRIMLSKRDA